MFLPNSHGYSYIYDKRENTDTSCRGSTEDFDGDDGVLVVERFVGLHRLSVEERLDPLF